MTNGPLRYALIHVHGVAYNLSSLLSTNDIIVEL